MNVLIDTSVWIEHFRRRSADLVNLIEFDLALTHPMILVELACGTPPAPRAQTLRDIGYLRRSSQASLIEVMDFIERDKLYGIGCGLVDLVLVASTLITPDAKIWTIDKRFAALAKRYDVLFQPKLHA